ncbi:uncharacterized protein LOC115754704 [Rhodamnia argentea]|uniref:Uncharacterized protein LOC115754704 n=1 Tax=Rhodamnia argentea TaxID=178133 RepID=A0A8B8QR54_9MYRT|nr:uncharacterized protein LOC115754704 [Rhodamnia argentea]
MSSASEPGDIYHELEHLRSENQSLRNEFQRVKLKNKRLEEELLKCRESSDECVVAAVRPGIAEDVYQVLMEKVGRGGGQTSLKVVFDEQKRKIDELEDEKRESESQVRVWAKKYKDLDERLSQLERDTSTLLGNRDGESQVLPEPDVLIDANGFGDRGSTQCGNDSNGGGSVSFTHNARKKRDFGTGTCLSPLVGPSRKSLGKEDRVLQGDGSSPIVEIIDSDDDCSGPSEMLSGDKCCGRGNDEKGNKKLKRKRDSVSSVSDDPLNQSLRDILASLKQFAQKNIRETDSDNSLSKSTGVNPIRHENGAGSASAKSDDGSSSHKERWKYVANMISDISKDDELCMKAFCALYRRQRSKSMERSACQGFSGLLAPSKISLAEFLTGGDPEGKLKKSVKDLHDHDPEGLIVCRSIAIEHSEQLFIMYRKKEDPFFPSS